MFPKTGWSLTVLQPSWTKPDSSPRKSQINCAHYISKMSNLLKDGLNIPSFSTQIWEHLLFPSSKDRRFQWDLVKPCAMIMSFRARIKHSEAETSFWWDFPHLSRSLLVPLHPKKQKDDRGLGLWELYPDTYRQLNKLEILTYNPWGNYSSRFSRAWQMKVGTIMGNWLLFRGQYVWNCVICLNELILNTQLAVPPPSLSTVLITAALLPAY